MKHIKFLHKAFNTFAYTFFTLWIVKLIVFGIFGLFNILYPDLKLFIESFIDLGFQITVIIFFMLSMGVIDHYIDNENSKSNL